MRETDPRVNKQIHDASAERSGLGDKSNWPAVGHTLKESGVQAGINIQSPDAVWSNDAHVIRSGNLGCGLFNSSAFQANFLKPTGDDDDVLDPAFPALGQNVQNGVNRKNDHRQVDRVRHRGNRGISLQAKQLVGIGVNWIHLPAVMILDKIADDSITQFIRVGGSSQYGHSACVKKV